MKPYDYKNRHVLLTGAGGGLGTALADLLLTQGARLVVSARSRESLAQLTVKPGVEIITADLSRPLEALELAGRALEALGHIDVLINNAGVGYHALMSEVDEEKIRYLFEVNTFAPLTIIRGLLQSMRHNPTGARIINVLSCTGYMPIPAAGAYGASKLALAAMTNAMRLELAPDGIDMISVFPGSTNTGFDRNALRENHRSGYRPPEPFGMPAGRAAALILKAGAGPPGEVWLNRRAKWMAAANRIVPHWIDRYFTPLRDKAVNRSTGVKAPEERRWRLWQVESAIACNLNCIMCPWTATRLEHGQKGLLPETVWQALVPYLSEVRSIDFTGGGEPLLQPHLFQWMRQAAQEGCQTGFLSNGLLLHDQAVGRLLEIRPEWIAFSVDGATREVYEKIRRGSDFERVCTHIANLTKRRRGQKPWIMINLVLMKANYHQVEEMVRLARKLGVDQVNFKQCDVIRGQHGRGLGLFAGRQTREIRALQKKLTRARRRARKHHIKTKTFAFTPEELPVCDQDPRDSLFVRHDGSVAPCINLAIGGPTTFMGDPTHMPTVHYGQLPQHDLMTLWHSEPCGFYQHRFQQRVTAHDRVLSNSTFEASLPKLQETLRAARDAMPSAPDGCRVCHYLYDI